MTEVKKIKTVDRPDSVALITAIELAIDDIASEKMTSIEVLGVLDLVGRRFYNDRLE